MALTNATRRAHTAAAPLGPLSRAPAVCCHHRDPAPPTDVAPSSLGPDDGYHGGHIVAVGLGGFTFGPNLFPQAGDFNVGAFAGLGRSWREALSEGCSVEVDIALAEGGDPDTPSFVIVTHWEDGVEETLALLNVGHAL